MPTVRHKFNLLKIPYGKFFALQIFMFIFFPGGKYILLNKNIYVKSRNAYVKSVYEIWIMDSSIFYLFSIGIQKNTRLGMSWYVSGISNLSGVLRFAWFSIIIYLDLIIRSYLFTYSFNVFAIQAICAKRSRY